MRLPLILAGALCSVLASCAPSSAIQRASESKSHFDPPPTIMSHNYPERDVFRVYQRGGSGFVPINAVRNAAEERAEAFARRQGRYMVVLGDKIASPPYILGNFPRVEVIFALTDKMPAPAE
ncbi:hypothetical protein [Haloferula sp. A504]|uniref:hypothetical protein n=1 Tax=Haloferula sp. A504 TaxID=3373601 RepID=UPI0031C07B2B|nr:hypothetical protein [Verrucomicrobiaceae bacterium E54]